VQIGRVEFAVGADRIIDVGEQVVALVWLRGRGHSSGADVEADVGAVFTLREGMVTRWEMTDPREALEAAGLSGVASLDEKRLSALREINTGRDEAITG